MSGGRRPSPAELSQIPETAWTIANARFAAIEPLLDRNVSRPSVQEQACHVGVDVSTLYRWLKKFRKSHLVSDLLPDTRGVRHGDKRLAADAEGVVTEVIGKRYLNKQRWSAQKICDEVAAQCRERGIEAPHPNTVRRRIAKLPPQTKVRAREGSRKAQEQFAPRVGQYPQPERPLADVQIDHTKVDIIVVDEVHRQPIGRPWITVAIDIFSRMVAGFYVSLDPPGALSTGLCLVHTMLPKQIWLAKHNIDSPWPTQGRIESLQCDNAREFHGGMLERACNNYGIPVGATGMLREVAVQPKLDQMEIIEGLWLGIGQKPALFAFSEGVDDDFDSHFEQNTIECTIRGLLALSLASHSAHLCSTAD